MDRASAWEYDTPALTRATRELGLAQMRRERFGKLQAGMQRRGLGALAAGD